MPKPSGARRATILIASTLLILCSAARQTEAQTFKDVKAPGEPLVLKEQGSFFVGGHQTTTDAAGWDQIGFPFGAGDVTVDQMYVQFQVPGTVKHTPIVFVHGCCLTSKTWETTPDGRMGWYEYFTRQGYPTFLAEQAGRGRSGFRGTIFNDVETGSKPLSAQPPVLLATYQFAWSVFRFGPEYGKVWPDEQYPMSYVSQMYKQVVPDMILTMVKSLAAQFSNPVTNDPTILRMSELAQQLGGAILVGHSQSSYFPTQAAIKDPRGIKAIIQLETGCFSNLTADQIKTLSRIPMLIVVGDHFSTPQPAADCQTEMTQINDAGGDFTFLALPNAGLVGNSHMMMQDKNNLKVADLIQAWIETHVEHKQSKN